MEVDTGSRWAANLDAVVCSAAHARLVIADVDDSIFAGKLVQTNRAAAKIMDAPPDGFEWGLQQ